MKPTPKQIITWLRWPNLVIVALTLLLIRYGVLQPALKTAGLSFALDTFSFVVLCLVTVLVTFSGYVINDFFDRETDSINKPHKQAVGVWISPGKALAIYLVLVVAGGLLSLYLAIKQHSLGWYWIYPAAIFLLWWYSHTLKSTVLWGNLLVSVFCAAVALLLPFTERSAIAAYPGQLMEPLIVYAVFAGLSNMLREIVKDAEDKEGDLKAGLTTLATRFGENSSRYLALLFVVLLGTVLCWFVTSGLLSAKVPFALLTGVPLACILLLLVKGPQEKDWKRLSAFSKILMVTGLIGLLFLR
jgi:4-hydroxybenzoate polyprenyltransferase